MKADYQKWPTMVNQNKGPTVIIPYVSACGYAKKIAFEIKEEILSWRNIIVKFMNSEKMEELIADGNRYHEKRNGIKYDS